MRGFVALHVRQLRANPLRSALAVAAVALGSALVVAVIGLPASMLTSVDRLAYGAFGGADLVVAAPADSGLGASVLRDVRAVEGVARAGAVVRAVVAVGPGQARAIVLSADPAAAAIAGIDASQVRVVAGGLRRIGRDDEHNPVAVGAALGRTGIDAATVVRVGNNRDVVTAAVDAVVAGPAVDDVNGGRIVLASLPVAQRLTGRPGRLDAVLVAVDPAADAGAVRAALEEAVDGRADVVTAADEAARLRVIVAPVVGGVGILAAVALFLATFLVYGTLARVGAERRSDLATLRALGAPRRFVARGLVLEGAALGATGAAIGSVAGVPLGRMLVGTLPDVFTVGLGTEISFHLPPIALAVAFGAGVVTAVLAAWLPARHAARIPPTDAMRPADLLADEPEPVRRSMVGAVIGGGLVAGGTAAGVALPPPASFAGAFLLMVGGVLAVRGLAAHLFRLAAAVARRLGTAGALAAESLGRSSARAWSDLVAIALAVAVVGGLTLGVGNTASAVRSSLGSLGDMDLLVATADAEGIPMEHLLPSGVRPQVAAVPGVQRVEGGQFAMALVDHKRVLVEGVEGDVPATHRASRAARRQMFAGDGAIVTGAFETANGLGVGDRIELTTPTGRHRVPILDVVPITGWPTGLVVLPAAQVRAWYQRPGASFLAVYLHDGADAAGIRRALAGRFADSVVPVSVITGDEAVEGTAASIEQSMQTLVAVAWVVVAAAALATFNTFMLAVLGRRRELGMLRAIGSSGRVVRRQVLIEALGVAVAGLAVGLPLAALLTALAGATTGGALGVDVPYRLDPIVLVAAGLAAGVACALGGWYPARQAARQPVVAAIGYE